VPASAVLAKHPHLSSVSVAAVLYRTDQLMFFRTFVLMLRASWPQSRKDFSGKWTIPIAAVSESDGTILEAVARLIINSTGFTANIEEFMGYYEETGVQMGGTNRTYTFLATLPRGSPQQPPPTALGPGYRFAAWFDMLRASDNWANYPCRAVGMFVNEAYQEVRHALHYKQRAFRVRNYKDDKDFGHSMAQGVGIQFG
jgi:hypothetical protein